MLSRTVSNHELANRVEITLIGNDLMQLILIIDNSLSIHSLTLADLGFEKWDEKVNNI